MREKERVASQTALLEGSQLVRKGRADVVHLRERARMKKLLRAIVFVGLIDFLLYRLWASGFALSLPHFGPEAIFFIPPLVMLIAIVGMPLVMLLNGKSPHITVYPEQVETALTEIKGLDNQVDEVIRSIDAFLGYATFKEELGGTPRRGILFEGPPGTGKTFLAKAMAKQAGVPFLFIPAPAFQSMWQGMSAFRIRSFFRKLRKAARKEGGAIGFIEEIDAVATARGGGAAMAAAPTDLVAHAVAVHGWRRLREHGERAADPDAVVRSATARAPDQGEDDLLDERLPADGLADDADAPGVLEHPPDRRDQPGRLA